MTDKELDKWLAENVKDWKIKKISRYVGHDIQIAIPYWYDKNNNETMKVEYWYPTKDIKQAMECEDRLQLGQVDNYIDALKEITKENTSGMTGCVEYSHIWVLIHATAEQRCLAIKASIEGMGELNNL